MWSRFKARGNEEDRKGKGKTYDIGPRVRRWQDVSGVGGGNDKVGDDSDGLDFFGPREFAVMADAQGRFRGLFPRIDSAGRGGKHLAQRDFLARHILGLEFVQVSADKAAEERCGDVIRVTFCPSSAIAVWACGMGIERIQAHRSSDNSPASGPCLSPDDLLHSPA